MESENKKIFTLLPQKLEKSDSAYSSVLDLSHVLQKALGADANAEYRIKNIAVTGPFGSGKSSVIQTLEEDYPDYKYLNISLATLRADEDIEKEVTDNKDKNERIETLNRKIEYSILQQIIYREKSQTVPNSRLRRIRHFEKEELKRYSLSTIAFIISFFIVFEPSWAKVVTFYQFFDFGYWGNLVADSIASIVMLYLAFRMIIKLIQAYSNSKLNKLNLKDGEIEMEEDTSIFNKHLDEILYFFQVTPYNVVVIEDLDRFGTSEIFLKLRELNQLINESKIVGRRVVFIYAVKDDVFQNEERTKFFDYITTVIPVINPSNSKDKLKAALAEKGFADGEIKDEDLAEMAFFIQDMRILKNIANEYAQYREKLVSANSKLDLTKLLAMIVYKNYFPKDFAELHRREGHVFMCLNAREKFLELAQEVLVKQKQELEDEISKYNRNNHLKICELRELFICELVSNINIGIVTIVLNNVSHTIKEIASNDNLFQIFLEQTTIQYQYRCQDYYGRQNTRTGDANVKVKEQFAKAKLKERIASLSCAPETFAEKKRTIDKQQLALRAMRLKDLIVTYKIYTKDEYKNCNLTSMMNVFVQNGYLDEDYYDYISYFYEGMVSLADRELLLSMKQRISKPFITHIDKVENFVKELSHRLFTADSILNIDLLDYLAGRRNTTEDEYFSMMMQHLEKQDASMEFLAQYCIYGKRQDIVMPHFIEWNEELAWKKILAIQGNEQRDAIIISWLKYAKDISSCVQTWIDSHYSFLCENREAITLDNILELIPESMFEAINNSDEDVLTCVIEHHASVITAHNLTVIVNWLSKPLSFEEDGITLTKIWNCKNPELNDCVQKNMDQTIECLSPTEKSESPEAIIFILNCSDIQSKDKQEYLRGQRNLIPNLDEVEKEQHKLAINLQIVAPSWKIVTDYMGSEETIPSELSAYIKHFSQELGKQDFVGSANQKELFFIQIIGSGDYSLAQVQELYPVFRGLSFTKLNASQLNHEHLQFLLSKRAIQFTTDNTEAFKSTKSYIDYLNLYHGKVMESLAATYFESGQLTLNVLQSSYFSKNDKLSILAVVPASIIISDAKCAELGLDLLIENLTKLEQHDKFQQMLMSCSNKDKATGYLSAYIETFEVQDTAICKMLTSLGHPFDEIATQEKRPKVNTSGSNIRLLDALKAQGFISSYGQEKDGKVQVFQKAKK